MLHFADPSSRGTAANGPREARQHRRRRRTFVGPVDGRQLRDDFLARVASPAGFDVLFEYLSDVYFFVKDAEGRFVRVNRGFADLARADSPDQVIGRQDADFFPADLAESYRRDDREVLRSRHPIVDKVELVRNPQGTVDWFCTTKLPLFDENRRAIGVCGITRDVKKMTTDNAGFLSWAPVLELLHHKYAEPLPTAVLAAKMALSVGQFNRQFRKKFRTTPRAYLTNLRMNAACHLLTTTDLAISDISLRTGYYDQSHFSNQFLRQRGLPPSQYRIKYASNAERQPASAPPELKPF
jgi:PAS domain S-box-containing protein